MICTPPPGTAPVVAASATRLAMYIPRLWDERRVLRVRPLPPFDPEIVARLASVEDGPEGWSSASAMQIVFVDKGFAEIRLSFEPGGSWSHVGITCAEMPQEEPTTNFGWFVPDVSDTELRRVWLHEAGHFLGAQHEQGTDLALSELPWDWEGFDAWHADRYLDVQVAREQWRTAIDSSVISHFVFDPDSIMLYYVPGEWMLDRKSRGGANTLSANDRLWMAYTYGAPPPPKSWVVWLPAVEG